MNTRSNRSSQPALSLIEGFNRFAPFKPFLRKKPPIPSFLKRVFLRPELEIAVSHDWPASSFILQPLSFQARLFPWKGLSRRVGFER